MAFPLNTKLNMRWYENVSRSNTNTRNVKLHWVMSMQFERDERKFDFHDIGLAIKRAREASGMTQEQLAFIIDRNPRTVMYNEDDGQHPSLNTFYQMVTMFDISVDQFFYPDKGAASGCESRIDVMLSSMDEKDLRLVETIIRAIKDAKETGEV